MSNFDPLMVNFVGYHISAPRGHCWLKFLHALENDQGFLAHTPLGMGVPQQFKKKHSKIGLKFGVLAVITQGPGRATSRNFST